MRRTTVPMETANAGEARLAALHARWNETIGARMLLLISYRIDFLMCMCILIIIALFYFLLNTSLCEIFFAYIFLRIC